MTSEPPAPARDDRAWLLEAIRLSGHCPPTGSAYAVGAIVVAADGTELSRGYSRESDPYDHAEEVALRRLGERRGALPEATLYTSLEPCTHRRSRPRSCTRLILDAGVGRVVFALREPPVLAECDGAETLAASGVDVVELPELGDLVRAANRDLLVPGQPTPPGNDTALPGNDTAHPGVTRPPGWSSAPR